MPSSEKNPLMGNLAGGVSSAATTLPTAVVSGLLAFAPLGPDYVSMGVQAGLYGTAVTAIITALTGGAPALISGARSSLAVIMGAVLATSLEALGPATDPALKAQTAMAMMFACVFLAGLLQVVFTLARMGRLIKYLPNAVIGGLLNGFAVFICIKQAPVVLGVGIEEKAWLAPLCAGAAIVTILLTKRWGQGLPAALCGLIVATLFFHLLDGTASGLAVVGSIPFGLPAMPDFTLLASAASLPALPDTLSAAVALAFLGSALALLSAVAVDSATGSRHDGNRVLLGQGLANACSALLGGVAGGGAPSRSFAAIRGGATGRTAGVVHGLTFLAALLGLGPFIGEIPMAALGGVLLVLSVQMLDTSEYRTAWRALRGKGQGQRTAAASGLLTTVLVTIVTLTAGFVVAAGIGLVGASLMFAMRMEKVIVRGRYFGDRLRSRTSRPRDALTLLEKEGRRIVMLEAQGAIFFGSADKLSTSMEEAGAEAETIILSLRGVSEVDDTAMKILRQTDRRLKAKGKVLLLSGLHPDSVLWDGVMGLAGDWDIVEGRTFADGDGALSWAEDRLLEVEGKATCHEDEIPIDEMDVFKGLSKQGLERVTKLFKRRSYGKGSTVVSQGAPSDEMFLLAAGTVAVMADIPGSDRQVRLAHMRPGVSFGEMGLITGAPRSTHVIAETDAVVHILDRKSYEDLSRKDPKILSQLLSNIAVELSEHLRTTSAQLSELEGRS